MFEVGFPELVLVAIIGLLVLGPQRLPKVAAEIGKWVGRARRTATQLRRQLEREIELNDIQPPPPPPARPAPAPTAAAESSESTGTESSGTEPAGTEQPPAAPADTESPSESPEAPPVERPPA
jgi:sec-independent protein translocase protein TatB